MNRTATAYHVPANTLAVGDTILDRHNGGTKITNIFVDDETTIVCKMDNGTWGYYPEAKEIRIAA